MATSFSGGGSWRTTDHGQAEATGKLFFVIYKSEREHMPYW